MRLGRIDDAAENAWIQMTTGGMAMG